MKNSKLKIKKPAAAFVFSFFIFHFALAQAVLEAPGLAAFKKVSASGGGGGSCTPSYANAGGTGNRTSSITVTAMGTAQGNSGDLINLDGGSLGNLVNGNTADNVLFFNAVSFDELGGNQPWWIQFDFGHGVIINEAKYYQQNSTSQGTWQWQGSNDASSWTNIGGTFSLVTASTTILTTLSANTTSYRYYRILGISGSTSNGPYIYEFEFSICSP